MLNGVTVQLFRTFHEWHDWKYAALDGVKGARGFCSPGTMLITTNKQCSGPFSLVLLVLWQSFWVQLSAWAGHWNMCFIRGDVFSFHGVTTLLLGLASSQSCCQFVIQLVAAGIGLSILVHKRLVWWTLRQKLCSWVDAASWQKHLKPYILWGSVFLFKLNLKSAYSHSRTEKGVLILFDSR